MHIVWACKDYINRLFTDEPQEDQQNNPFLDFETSCGTIHHQQVTEDYSPLCYRKAVAYALEEAFLVQLYLMEQYRCVPQPTHTIWAHYINQNPLIVRTKFSASEKSELQQQIIHSVTALHKSEPYRFKTLYQWASKDSDLEPCCRNHINATISRAAITWRSRHSLELQG